MGSGAGSVGYLPPWVLVNAESLRLPEITERNIII